MVSSKFFAVGKLFVVLVVTGVLGAAVLLPYFGGVGLVARSQADRFLDTQCNLNETANEQTSTLYASDGKTLIAKFFSQNRTVVPLSQINEATRRALIDTEDRRFYEHHGVDPRGLARAVLNESGGETQGASTLTQQYVKQVRFYQAKTDAEKQAAIEQTPQRKIVEAKCALQLEKKYTKDQILEKYFNIAYFGQQSYGIAVAARNYFNKTPAQLTIPDAAVLVGLVKSPTAFNPFLNPKESLQRRNEVIENMVAMKDITQAQADAYKKQPIKVTTQKTDPAAQGCSFANQNIKNVGFFCDYVVSWLQNTGGISEETLQRGGLRIVSSISPTVQNTAQQTTWDRFDPSSGTLVAMPVIDPKTGRILAMTTSKYYNYGEAHNKDPKYTSVPIFTRPATGSGSTFKYFTAAAALSAGATDNLGIYTPQPYFPHNCNADPSNQANYIRNAGNGYSSYFDLRDALVQSSNTYFVGMEDQFFGCNLSTIVDMARKLGVTSISADDAKQIVANNQYTFTLGQTVVSPLELTVAYGVAANDGVLAQSSPVVSITDTSGKPVNYKKPQQVRVLSQWAARTLINMLIGDSQSGTAASQFTSFYNEIGSDGHLVASKTGTNNASTVVNGEAQDNGTNAALWFVGITPRMAAATAVFNPISPTKTIDIPGLGTNTSDTFGAYGAGQVWIPALQPFLAKQSWQWPAADQIEGSQPVPTSDIIGRSESDAISAIQSAGFKPAKYPIDCGSRYAVPGTVAYAGPQFAAPGSVVTYCLNSVNSLSSAPPPPATKPPAGPSSGNPAPSNPPSGGRPTAPPRRGR